MQFCHIDKIDSHIQFFQTLASLYVLNFADIIKREIEILKFLEFIKIFHLIDDIILKV